MLTIIKLHLANMYKWERLSELGKCSPLRGKLLAWAAPVFTLLMICFKMFKSSKVLDDVTRVHRSRPAISLPQPWHQLSGGNSCPGEDLSVDLNVIISVSLTVRGRTTGRRMSSTKSARSRAWWPPEYLCGLQSPSASLSKLVKISPSAS